MAQEKERETIEIKRDPKSGRITGFTGSSEMLPKALNVLMASLLDSLNISLDKFNKSSAKYARALLFLTAALIVVAIIQVVALWVG